MEEQRDGRDASDVDGVAARDDAHEELRGEIEEVGGRWRAIDPHDLLRSLRWTPVGVGPQPGYTRRLGKQ